MQLPSIQQLLAQKMDRRQFLRTVGLVVLVAIGLGFLLKQQHHASSAPAPSGHPHNDIYGA